MPKMDHTGPEGEGPRTGRKLGRCSKDNKDASTGKLGKGMGKKRKEGCGQGKGKRLQSHIP
ncbi:DUF5320 domain-containing protein [Thermophagus sp. OGC60D27]|uniref:DUF5320 domain-containing protein n=1 Tax=Thermophagus sp. OGC60D27 TaxID=3458415 RepID=UPI0040379A49